MTTRGVLPAPLRAGDSMVVAVPVQAPPAPGDYVVELDLVHELVRWFERPLRIPVRVAERPAPRPLCTSRKP